ncbi:hypothetical protein PSHT_13736 [Puccinia striiformis]|nr:hypothetical protein PSHT_13736 [Puccinia striiformis]
MCGKAFEPSATPGFHRCTNSGLKSYQCRTGSCGNVNSFTFSRCVKYTDAGGVGVGEVPSVRFQSFMDHPESGYLDVIGFDRRRYQCPWNNGNRYNLRRPQCTNCDPVTN